MVHYRTFSPLTPVDVSPPGWVTLLERGLQGAGLPSSPWGQPHGGSVQQTELQALRRIYSFNIKKHFGSGKFGFWFSVKKAVEADKFQPKPLAGGEVSNSSLSFHL